MYELLCLFSISNSLTIYAIAPSIKTGVSFELKQCNRLYAICSKNSSNAREFQEGLLRVRNISSKEYVIHLGKTLIGNSKTQHHTILNSSLQCHAILHHVNPTLMLFLHQNNTDLISLR